MKIAVLMSTYNGDKFLQQQIDSILNQRGLFDLQLIVRDDGSTDNTVSILNDYQKKKQLYWYQGENLGPAKSFIDLLIKSKGYDYYFFSDQDDVWYEQKVEKALKELQNKDGYAVYFSNALMVDENLNSLGRNVYKKPPKLDFETLSCAGGLLGCTMGFNSKLAAVVADSTSPSQIIMHDFFLAELCAAIGGEIVYDEYASMKYRQHGNNVIGVSSSKHSAINRAAKTISKKAKISISDQAEVILSIYDKFILHDNKNWLKKISKYRKNLITAFKLAFCQKIRFVSFNSSLQLRLAIAFRNR